MQLQNKNRIAYLGAMTLLFSYAELFLPRFLPFFRLGLGNIAILKGLNLGFYDFIILTIIKSVSSSMMNGTLLSPFFLISICQSVISGLAMKLFYKISKQGKFFSLYGISLIGSAISAIVQLMISSIYLGLQTLRLLGPMLLFSLISGILTAFIANVLEIPESTPSLQQQEQASSPKYHLFFTILILTASIFCFMINNLWILSAALFTAVVLQIKSGRKILLLPHLYIWIFIILISIFSPEGRIIFTFKNLTITQGAVFNGIRKALKLSIAAALSQCAVNLQPSNNSIFGLTLAYYKNLLTSFKNQDGNLINRLQSSFNF